MILSNDKMRDFLAFVHIEKAAGTTLIHILRHNYFMRYCDVRPFRKESKGQFRISDLRQTLAINPFIKCIAGHSVRPFGDLQDQFPNILFITLLRDPVKRYVSRYQYFVEKRGKRFSFEKFLTLEEESNFQTKKIVGNENLDLAKAILSDRFFMVGVVEKFDEFLILLKRKLEPRVFDPRYEIQNVAKDQAISQYLHEKYCDPIIENNQIDIELYQYVKEDLTERERTAYGPNLEKDLADFKAANVDGPIMSKRYLDFICRKLYYEPLTGFVRSIHGLPPKGSY